MSDKAIEAAVAVYSATDAPSLFDAMRAAIAAYEAAMWQPIDDAPKDGSPVLVFDRNDGRQDVAVWEADFGLVDDGVWSVEGMGVSPTHFRPLPAPPSAPTEGDA